MKAVVLIKSAAPSVIHVGVPKECVAAPYKSTTPRPSAELLKAETKTSPLSVVCTISHSGLSTDLSFHQRSRHGRNGPFSP
jgi:hypothetical protein